MWWYYPAAVIMPVLYITHERVWTEVKARVYAARFIKPKD